MTFVYRLLTTLITASSFLVALSPTAVASDTRIKDIVSVESVRDNHLIGYGLVVGLNGTGDTLKNSPFTQQSLAAMLEHQGVNVRDIELKTKNVAAVMVTATLPPFARHGTRIDVNVSALGDAKDLRGGTLLITSLLGFGGVAYASAQGPVTVSGFNVRGNAAEITQGIPTTGRIPNGAIIEEEIEFELDDMQSLKLSLRNPDVATSLKIANEINNHFKQKIARSMDPSTIQLVRPVGFKIPLMNMLAEIEALRVEPETRAKVVIDQRTGIIVIGKDVKVSTVAVAQGNLTITVSETPEVSQPAPFSDGDTTILNRSDVSAEEKQIVPLKVLNENVTLQELVSGIRQLGAEIGPRDMIAILQALKAAGALQADIEVM